MLRIYSQSSAVHTDKYDQYFSITKWEKIATLLLRWDSLTSRYQIARLNLSHRMNVKQKVSETLAIRSKKLHCHFLNSTIADSDSCSVRARKKNDQFISFNSILMGRIKIREALHRSNCVYDGMHSCAVYWHFHLFKKRKKEKLRKWMNKMWPESKYLEKNACEFNGHCRTPTMAINILWYLDHVVDRVFFIRKEKESVSILYVSFGNDNKDNVDNDIKYTSWSRSKNSKQKRILKLNCIFKFIAGICI